jgi:hypothetical protein
MPEESRPRHTLERAVAVIVRVDLLHQRSTLVHLHVHKHAPAFGEARDELVPGLILHLEA